MEQLNIFHLVKQSVTTRQAASFYGLNIGRNGMCRCPFHNDHTPSMKVDERFHCFGCQADGDVIDFTARLFDISPLAAAQKLAADFGLSSGISPLSEEEKKKILERKRERLKQTGLQKEIYNMIRTLIDYHWLLRDWKEQLAPESPNDPIDPLFVEALHNIDKVNYYLDSLMEGSHHEQIAFLLDHRKEVKRIEERIRKYHDEPGVH